MIHESSCFAGIKLIFCKDIRIPDINSFVVYILKTRAGTAGINRMGNLDCFLSTHLLLHEQEAAKPKNLKLYGNRKSARNFV
jgi:hypothetical protein